MAGNLGPWTYENWNAWKSGEPSTQAFEYLLYTDVHLTGEIGDSLGPYSILNTIAQPVPNTPTPALVARIDCHLPLASEDPTRTTSTDVDRYHGGDIADEFAALLSLLLGARFKSGGWIRRFSADGDPRGQPFLIHGNRFPVLLKSTDVMLPTDGIIPNTSGTRSLSDCSKLARYFILRSSHASLLIRSARRYQEALWVSEMDPYHSWLMFVSAIETIAGPWKNEVGLPEDQLKASMPKLAALLYGSGGDELLSSASALLADRLGATNKFVSFICSFLPEPPLRRPPGDEAIPWSKTKLKDALSKVYDLRSRALHGGVPFPLPMCLAPRDHGSGYEERPRGLAAGSIGAVWQRDDMPMMLHTFEHLVRGSILGWWDSVTSGRQHF